jgi:hypothetical protein
MALGEQEPSVASTKWRSAKGSLRRRRQNGAGRTRVFGGIDKMAFCEQESSAESTKCPSANRSHQPRALPPPGKRLGAATAEIRKSKLETREAACRISSFEFRVSSFGQSTRWATSKAGLGIRDGGMVAKGPRWRVGEASGGGVVAQPLPSASSGQALAVPAGGTLCRARRSTATPFGKLRACPFTLLRAGSERNEGAGSGCAGLMHAVHRAQARVPVLRQAG